MDRFLGFNGENFEAQDIDKTNKFSMIGLGKLGKAILGEGPWINDLTCVPAVPPSLHVTLNPGEIYQMGDTDESEYGPLDADDHPLLKQGILLDDQDFEFSPPGTPGYSINYLIQVQELDDDVDEEDRAFFEAPSATVPTRRQSQLVAESKAGTPAPTGTQITPTPDAGFVGAWVITVENGQTEITSDNIEMYVDAPFILEKLGDKISETRADARYAKIADGMPIGFEMAWPGAIPPINFWKEDGSEKNRVTYATLFSVLTFTLTGDTSSGSPSITNLVSDADLTTSLFVGMPIEGTNIPAGSTILSIDGPDSITISHNASGTGTGVSLRGFPHGNGDGSTTFNIPAPAGRMIIAAGLGTDLTLRKLAENGGNETHSQTEDEVGPHMHINTQAPIEGGSDILQAGSGFTVEDFAVEENTPAGEPMDIMNPFTGRNFVIKYQ